VTFIRKHIHGPVGLILLLAILGSWPTIILARPAQQTEETDVAAEDTFLFTDMGLGEQTLVGPLETRRLPFNLPADWELSEGTFVQLELSTSVIQTGVAPEGEPSTPGGSLTISFNGQRLGIFTVTDEPSRTIKLDIPEVALAGNAGRHELAITLDTRRECGADIQVNVVVQGNSFFGFPHENIALPLDLTLLPRPLYQRTFLPESAFLVLPDAPSAAEMQAALTVAAGFGRMTGDNLALTVRRESELNEDEAAASNLIMVGKPGSLGLLNEVTLPVELADTAFALETMQGDDGIIQIARSPLDRTRLALVISGNSDNGIIKASKALAAQQLLVDTETPDYSVIAEVNNELAETIQPDTQSFASLGYATRRVDQPGVTALTYDFSLPQGYAPDDEAYSEIYFAHSALLDYNQSGLVVLVNGNEVGSARFSEASTSLSSVRMTIPRSALRIGNNTLALRVTLLPTISCFDREALDIWFTAWPESVVHLPLGVAPEQAPQSRSLDLYPQPFTTSPSLNTMAFVLSESDPESWQTALSIASELGTQANSQFIDLVAAYSSAVPEELRNSRDLLIVGRPTQLPLLAEINDSLPAPFAAGSDQAISRITQITFRTEGESVGYLQLLRSPWNQQRTVLAVLGSSPEGLGWAGQALIRGSLRSRLGGTFALVVNEQIFIGGTRLATPIQEPPPPAATTTGVITSTNVISPGERPATNYPDARPPSSGPSLLLPLSISIGTMLLVVGGIAAFMWTRQNGGMPLLRRKKAVSDGKAQDTKKK
jgi:cellulose synthase operon protein B